MQEALVIGGSILGYLLIATIIVAILVYIDERGIPARSYGLFAFAGLLWAIALPIALVFSLFYWTFKGTMALIRFIVRRVRLFQHRQQKIEVD